MAWWTFRIFFAFFCSGEGKGESEAPEKGGRIFTENPRSLWREGGGEGAGRVSAGNFQGGGLNIFFRVRKTPTKMEK